MGCQKPAHEKEENKVFCHGVFNGRMGEMFCYKRIPGENIIDQKKIVIIGDSRLQTEAVLSR
ncbi:MAG: hypothetical protein A3D31_19340 [Candidatus Fluviicola riflensis]|nr:MAG: hypothetical protein A3D31_19340 [Candidatus Fluviicola riflensis]OGS83620.1 MAG: hypothetical protein A2724_19355 [Fluviicola sp. RIFCSPHIGHO2_01_FULL_43_53]OGS85759.1 MAG: hypothetical protein A3E30_18885 [Fluviicola sp. RIFCSPHIGHO2_12_FULL_43_24]